MVEACRIATCGRQRSSAGVVDTCMYSSFHHLIDVQGEIVSSEGQLDRRASFQKKNQMSSESGDVLVASVLTLRPQ